jgi:hypothetical protein
MTARVAARAVVPSIVIMPRAGASARPLPPLRPYSAQPRRLALQIASDVFVLIWIYVWYRIGQLVHDTLVQVAGVGYRIQGSAGQVSGSLTQAGKSAGNVPLVGDQLGKPLANAGAQIGDIAGAGRSAGDTLTNLATPLGWAVALGPILLVLAIWLPRRWRFARRAGEAAEMAAVPAGEELLALRALANQPLHELRRVTPDPVGAWRDGDVDAVRALAHLELIADGVRWRRPPRVGARALDQS